MAGIVKLLAASIYIYIQRCLLFRSGVSIHSAAVLPDGFQCLCMAFGIEGFCCSWGLLNLNSHCGRFTSWIKSMYV